MSNRLNIQALASEAFNHLFSLEDYLQKSQLSKTHFELIKIRASQLNGCAFCINMHTKDALKYGETAQRIFLLNAWKESGLFTEEEQVILSMTEEITFVHQGGLSEETYQAAEAIFDQQYVADIIMAIVVINAWNRIAISTKKEID